MSKLYKAASSAGAVALVLSGSVMAAAPAFDAWTVSTGTITGNTQAGFTYGSALSDKGFFQRQVTETATGQVFFQTIITENNATAATVPALDALLYADESFVRTGNVNGIADKQRISDVDGTKTFNTSATLNSGWAGDKLTLTQRLKDTADNFQTDFIFSQKGPSTAPTAKGVKITAYIPIAGADKQDFVLVDLQGDYANVVSNVAAGKSTVTVPVSQVMTWANDTSANTIGTAGGTEGDRIKAIWVGQDMTTAVGQVFGLTSYDNITSVANDYISTFSLTGTAAVSWDTAVWGNLTTSGTVTNPFP